MNPIARLVLAPVKMRAPSLVTSVRSASTDWMHTVGPWPRTKEERERAAKKYNLIPEDYEPYGELEALGDYPKLPEVGAVNRDPYEDFDDICELRNHGEPMHHDYELYLWERIDPLEDMKPDHMPWWKLFPLFFAITGFFPALFYLCEKYKLHFTHNRKDKSVTPREKLFHFPKTNKSSSH